MISPQTAHPLSGTAAEYVWLLPILPLLGFVINGLLSLVPAYHVGPKDPSRDPMAGHTGEHPIYLDINEHGPHRHRYARLVDFIGPAVVALSFVLALMIFAAFRGAGEVHTPFVKTFWSWIPAGDLQLDWSMQLDQLSMVMVLVITGVGTLIHLFSVGYMHEDPGYPRYFAYLNLFVFFMLMLVLGASYPVLFVGWEGVGLCSYLLIGFWFSETANANAGKKAFIVNRIGDFGFLIAIFLLWTNLGTLDFAGVAANAGKLAPGGPLVTAICLFIFLGCCGKSAQMPLYMWLPDAMAGPTPVSALIHAATMVTAGVYLVARSANLFSLAPVACLVVAIVGCFTALFAASIGLKQWDIKKVLAYSTVSQLGYMFVAVGVGAYTAGVFHLVTHAFFKALLFLGSGSVIYAMHEAYHHTHSHEDPQDMRNMGGLRSAMPVTWVLMWIATLAIAGIPVFSGFFSKDEILGSVFQRAQHSVLADTHLFGIPGRGILYTIYFLGIATAFITAVYMTRMMLYTFHGPNRTGETERHHLHEAPWIMTGPLVVLGILSGFGGWLNLPKLIPIGQVGVLDHWLEPVVGQGTARLLGGTEGELAHGTEVALVGAAVAIAVIGVVLAVVMLKPARLVPARDAAPEHGIEKVLAGKYFVDEGIEKVVVGPTVAVSRSLLWRGIDMGLIDGLIVNGSAAVANLVSRVGSLAQSGSVGNYAWAIVVGVLVLVGALTLR